MTKAEKPVITRIEEREQSMELILELLNITLREFVSFRDLIQKHNGKVRISMHPNTISDREEGEKYFKEYFMGHLMSEHYNDFLENGEPSVMPTIVFIDGEFYETTKETLEGVFGVDLLKAGILMIPTKYNMGEPIDLFNEKWVELREKILGPMKPGEMDHLTEEKKNMFFAFQALIFIFKNLMINSVDVSGGFVGARSVYDATLDRCLGYLVLFLNDYDIKVHFSDWVLYEDDLSADYLKEVGVIDEDGNMKK